MIREYKAKWNAQNITVTESLWVGSVIRRVARCMLTEADKRYATRKLSIFYDTNPTDVYLALIAKLDVISTERTQPPPNGTLALAVLHHHSAHPLSSPSQPIPSPSVRPHHTTPRHRDLTQVNMFSPYLRRFGVH
jgi:hypothetical protein